eukprot:TRINITY_DN56689_c0_g1_i1.p1 TRINITY_DN56689_c0_g1~~TRINITY_DN56689_c0_g1_i1.p1  ORF type:complete len:216 (+),score=40.55 TRINITY_DN56689_c0_g1_i1:69-650(+)
MVSQMSFMPDEVLVSILEAHAGKSDARAVATRCRQLVDSSFEIRRVRPPAGEAFFVDFEVDCSMAKHLYCAQFGRPSGAGAGMTGSVTFQKWLPAYLRGKVPQHVHHSLQECDVCELWKFISKVRDQRSSTSAEGGAAAMGNLQAGHLTVCEGDGSCTREVIGRLSLAETEMMLSVLDYRRNAQAQPVAVEAA